MTPASSVEFFEQQFRQQVARGELALNPFERAALPWLRGSVLDYGCGLGNLALHAARQGLPVLALDGSTTAIEHLNRVAQAEALPLQARQADLRDHQAGEAYDTVVCIGLLMFFDCACARRQLARLRAWVRPGGVAVLNVLVEGTSYLEMFSDQGHCLFAPDELARSFADWQILLDEPAQFAAPGDTIKRFSTLIARRPA